MANYRSIAAVSRAVITLLEANYDRALFDHDLEFDVYTNRDFQSPMTAGVSLFVYRVFHNGTNRTPPGRIGADGRRQRPRLPLDLHFMLTAWAPTASLQQVIIGWMMRVLEDHSLLPAGFLNHAEPGSFRPDEIIELGPIELTTEDLLNLWERLANHRYVLSVPYVARTVMIESDTADDAPRDVNERLFAMRELVRGGT